MITYKTLLEAAKKDTIVLAWGRLNPPTSGHELLVKSVAQIASKHNADHVIYVTKTQDPKKNPLTVDQKVFYAKASFKGMNIVGASDSVRTFMEAAKLLNKKYKNLIMVAGSDRLVEYKTILDRYNGKDYNFNSILVVSAGERDPDSDAASGMSATKMRQAAAANDFNKFKQGTPSAMPPAIAKKMFDDVRAGMQIGESVSSIREDYINERIFAIGEVVEFKDQEWIVSFRGSNYVLLEREGQSQKAWLQEIKTTGRIDEAMMVKQQDKLKAAKIIGMTLGYADAENKSDPSMIVNNAIRSIRNKSLNAESKKIIARMLQLAKEMEISFDEKLGTFVSEGVQDTADFKVTASGRKVRAHRVVVGDEEDEDERQVKEASVVKVDTNKKDNISNDIMSAEDKKRLMSCESEEKDEEDFDEDDVLELHDDISDEDIIEHGYDDEDFHITSKEKNESEEFNEVALQEVLSRVERMRAVVRMRRSEAKRQHAEEIALKRKSTSAVLARRARRIAVKTLEKKLAKKPLEQLSVGEKERIEQRIQLMKPAITRLASKLIPRVRQIEKTRLSNARTAS